MSGVIDMSFPFCWAGHPADDVVFPARDYRAKRKKATPAGPPFAMRAYIAQRPFASTICSAR